MCSTRTVHTILDAQKNLYKEFITKEKGKTKIKSTLPIYTIAQKMYYNFIIFYFQITSLSLEF